MKKYNIADKMVVFLKKLSSHKRTPIKRAWLRNRDFVKKCLSRFGDYLLDLPTSMQLDEELVQIALKNKPLLACQYPWSENKEWVKMAIHQNPHIIQHIKVIDFELAQLAVENSHGVFVHLFGKIHLDDYVRLCKWVQLRNPYVYEYLNPDLQNNPEFIENLLSKDLSCGELVPLSYFEDHFEWVVKAWNFQYEWARHDKLQNRFPQRYVDLFRQRPDMIGKQALERVKECILENDGMMIYHFGLHFGSEKLGFAFHNQFNRKKFFNHGSLEKGSPYIWYKNKIPLPKSNPLFMELSMVEPSLSKPEYCAGMCLFYLCELVGYQNIEFLISCNPFLSICHLEIFYRWCKSNSDYFQSRPQIPKPWLVMYSTWVKLFSPS